MNCNSIQKRTFVKREKNQAYIDIAVYNFIRFSKPISEKGVSGSCIAHNLDLTPKEVFESLKRLNNKGVKIKKLCTNVKI